MNGWRKKLNHYERVQCFFKGLEEADMNDEDVIQQEEDDVRYFLK